MEMLARSVRRLDDLVDSLDEAQYTQAAYPSEWSIAQVLSHLGSGALIQQRRLTCALAGEAMPEAYPQSVWAEWDAKEPARQVVDGLVADAALLDELRSVPPLARPTLTVSLGPLSFGFEEFVGLRVNELVLHTWDVEVAVRPDAVLPADAAAFVIDNLSLVARFTAKPTTSTRVITIVTTDPMRAFTVDLSPEAATLTADESGAAADLSLPAEAFIRLVYGRLDRLHTPQHADHPELDDLRRVFPGP
jgi:uncharacterized protein (TIGR03083 family)